MDTIMQVKSTDVIAISHQEASDCRRRNVWKKPSRMLIILGGAICLSRCHSSLGAKVAMAYILTKLTQHNSLVNQNRSE